MSAFLAARSPATAKTCHEETARVGIARQQFKALLFQRPECGPRSASTARPRDRELRRGWHTRRGAARGTSVVTAAARPVPRGTRERGGSSPAGVWSHEGRVAIYCPECAEREFGGEPRVGPLDLSSDSD